VTIVHVVTVFVAQCSGRARAAGALSQAVIRR
jgi:hypothetical protein